MRTGSTPADVRQLLQHSAWVRRLAWVLVRDEALADDVVQETWLAALRSPPRAGEPPRPWLGQVLRNVVRMRLRGEGRRQRREEHAASDGPGSRPSASCEHLVEAVEAQRLLSAAQIATRQGVPAATVRGRLKQGRERLRARLDTRPGGRGAWLGALAPLADGRHVAGLGGAAAFVITK